MFLAELHPAQDSAARAAVLEALRRRDHDATHHCSAWRGGLPVTQFGSDDDGEPSGTAGKPMLRVLEGAGLTDCLAVCIRWYGGTKLGTGGLVRAYTEALQGAIAAAETAGLLEPLRLLRVGHLTVPAEAAHLPFALLGGFPSAEVLGQEFTGEAFVLRFACPPGAAEALETAWRDKSRGGSVQWED